MRETILRTTFRETREHLGDVFDDFPSKLEDPGFVEGRHVQTETGKRSRFANATSIPMTASFTVLTRPDYVETVRRTWHQSHLPAVYPQAATHRSSGGLVRSWARPVQLDSVVLDSG